MAKRFSGVLPQEPATITKPATIPAPFSTALEYRGFNKGLNQVLYKDYNQVIAELREALGINSRAGLHHYRHGVIRLRAEQAARVIQVFNKYGITEIWDA